jgi:hypothetical protein
MQVRSTAQPAAIFNAGSVLNFKNTCVQGMNVTRNGGQVANLSTSCVTSSDPYEGKLPRPAVACERTGGNYKGGTVNLTPGVYCGWTNFNGAPRVQLAPGVYVIRDGGWNVNGGVWSGSGVTFYFADSSMIQFNSGIEASLSAPTTGLYAGILMYEADGLPKSNFTFDDSKRNALNGLIYLPSRTMTFNSGSNLTGDNVSLVVNRLILNATNWNLSASAIPVAGVGMLGSQVSGAPPLVN